MTVLELIEDIISALPLRLVQGLGTAIGRFGYILDGQHRKLAISNITKVFGSTKTKRDIEKIARMSFQNLGKTVIEFIRDVPEGLVQMAWHDMDDLVKRHKGVIFILGHFGNWEILGRLTASRGIKFTAVGKAVRTRRINEYITNKRHKAGLEMVDKKGALGELLKALRRNRSVAILIDQYAGRHGVFVNFFGIPTSTTSSPAVLALRTGAPVVPVFTVRTGTGYKGFIEPPIYVTRTGNIARDIYTNTQKFTESLEKYVRMYPEQWWWVHRRWR